MSQSSNLQGGLVGAGPIYKYRSEFGTTWGWTRGSWLRQSLEAHTKGIYSPNLPSPGYLAAVECIEDGCVRFRTHYLFLGSTVNELGTDGFDLIKPLCKP